MTSKPQCSTKVKRLSERDAVTIIAGFQCVDGVVLCADTQETIGGLSKLNVPKLRCEPPNFAVGFGFPSDLAVAFCGAGSGPFIDKLVDRAWEEARQGADFDDACLRIEGSIKEVYREYGQIYQPGFVPEAELIYGVRMDERSGLFQAVGPLVNEKSGYVSGGMGCYLANFLASRMHGSHLSVRQGIIIAAFVLFQTKEHVDGCGGESHIAVLRDRATSGKVDSKRVESLTSLLAQADRSVGEILVHCADLGLSKNDFLSKSVEIVELLETVREHEVGQLKEHYDFMKALFGGTQDDELGLPKPFEENPPESGNL